eukprot:4739749-Pleurochrysis_carterae.AAC.1
MLHVVVLGRQAASLEFEHAVCGGLCGLSRLHETGQQVFVFSLMQARAVGSQGASKRGHNGQRHKIVHSWRNYRRTCTAHEHSRTQHALCQQRVQVCYAVSRYIRS